MAKSYLFPLKEDENQSVSIAMEDVAEIVPDADFRFSLIILKNGEKHFVSGTKEQIWQKLKMLE